MHENLDKDFQGRLSLTSIRHLVSRVVNLYLGIYAAPKGLVGRAGVKSPSRNGEEATQKVKVVIIEHLKVPSHKIRSA